MLIPSEAQRSRRFSGATKRDIVILEEGGQHFRHPRVVLYKQNMGRRLIHCPACSMVVTGRLSAKIGFEQAHSTPIPSRGQSLSVTGTAHKPRRITSPLRQSPPKPLSTCKPL